MKLIGTSRIHPAPSFFPWQRPWARPWALACILTVAIGGIGSGTPTAAAASAMTSPPAGAPAASPTAWTASVHAALARQARQAMAVARHVFTQSGVASWYGHEFTGRRTSSGVRFDPMRLTCAHRTLPLGTRLLVTSQRTGRSVVVTVNDRGPFAGADRIIDLSGAAAARIGMVRNGLSLVTVKGVAPVQDDVEVAQAAASDSSAQALAAIGNRRPR